MIFNWMALNRMTLFRRSLIVYYLFCWQKLLFCVSFVWWLCRGHSAECLCVNYATNAENTQKIIYIKTRKKPSYQKSSTSPCPYKGDWLSISTSQKDFRHKCKIFFVEISGQSLTLLPGLSFTKFSGWLFQSGFLSSMALWDHWLDLSPSVHLELIL